MSQMYRDRNYNKSGHQGLRGRGNEEFLLNENRTSVWEDEKSSQD